MAKLKVFGGSYLGRGRMIVAARSIKRVAELTGLTRCYIRTYWSPTGNQEQIDLACKFPEVVFYRDDTSYGIDWLKFKKWRRNGR
jgi:hypothetical protein